MAEYLSPGVYVEEFDSGSKPMEGVGTSTAGFIGLAERGPVEGLPQLVTNFSDFKRKYGGYLSENEFGEYRFLAYAVEHFFINGGARCFIVRVAPEDAKCAAAAVPSEDGAVLTLGISLLVAGVTVGVVLPKPACNWLEHVLAPSIPQFEIGTLHGTDPR